MTLPGTDIIRGEALPSRTPPTSIGVGFEVGLAEKGPTDRPVKIRSQAEFIRVFGRRVAYSLLYDWVETFFREGGSELYVVRVVGAGASSAEATFADAAAAASLTIRASSSGDWGNSLNGQILAGDAAGEFKIQISHDTDGVIVTSPSLPDKAAAMAWADSVDAIVLESEASPDDPAPGAVTSLATGTDDRASITDADKIGALALFTKDLGPGMVDIVGATTEAAHVGIANHCDTHNRVGIVSMLDTPNREDLTSHQSAVRAATLNERWLGAFWPWDVIPGLTPGTTRTVPPSARIMGNLAALAGAGSTGNVAAAGDRGVARWVIGLSQPKMSDADRESLNDAGVNVSIIRFGSVTTYGWRTAADVNGDPNWIDLGNTRLYTQIAALADVIGESFVFEEIDGEGRVFSRFKGRLTGMLLPFWTAGSLYGATQQEAFEVDTGPAVNDEESIKRKEINADLGLQMSPHGEKVRIRITKESAA